MCFILPDIFDYRIVALILLVCVSLIAMFFQMLPVLFSACLSALVWNYFFIAPRFTFHIEHAEDVLMFLMYFVIALVNAVLTSKIRAMEKISSKKEEREKTLKLYNTLLNSLSHELRTPIATIIGATDNLVLDSTDLHIRINDEQKMILLNEISKASLRLNRQVENLLNMSRVESGVIVQRPDWCDMKELIYDVIGSLNDLLGNRKIIVSIDDNFPFCKLDHVLVEQILVNLLLNANSYTPDDKNIQITVITNESSLIITIDDNGPGFPADEIELVFEKFYRLRNSRPGGTGLGLSIVKGFVEAQNGKITLENKPEGGAKFVIDLPAEFSYLNNLKNE